MNPDIRAKSLSVNTKRGCQGKVQRSVQTHAIKSLNLKEAMRLVGPGAVQAGLFKTLKIVKK